MPATIFNKTLTAGDSKAVVLEPGMELLRETNLPLDWTRVRIGLIGSWTNLATTNGTPNAETVPPVQANPKTSIVFGLSNGIAFCGTVGNRFVGVRSAADGGRSLYMQQVSSNWVAASPAASSSMVLKTIFGDGVSLSETSEMTQNGTFQVNDPTANASCLFGLAIDLQRSTSNDGRMSFSRYSPGTSPLSSASDVQINNLLNANAYSSGVNQDGGWWTANNATPIDCRFLSIRSPFILNRLVVHNVMIQQIQ